MIRLRELRIASGRSQNEIASLLNVAQNTVSQWELGKREPSLDKMVELANIFNTKIDNLLSGDAISKMKEINPLLKTGDRIRKIRKMRGYTRKKLSEISGVAEITISQYETFKRNPMTEKLLKIAYSLNDTAKALLGDVYQGHVIILPCKPGNTVYYQKGHQVESAVVTCIRNHLDTGWQIILNGSFEIPLDNFSCHFHLTPEAVNAAIERSEEASKAQDAP